jgi:hypothetical protein
MAIHVSRSLQPTTAAHLRRRNIRLTGAGRPKRISAMQTSLRVRIEDARSSSCCCLLPCCRLLVSISPSVDVIGIKAARLSPSVSSLLLGVSSARPRPTQTQEDQRKKKTKAAIPWSPTSHRRYTSSDGAILRSSWSWHPVPRGSCPSTAAAFTARPPCAECSVRRCPLGLRVREPSIQLANCKRAGARFRPHSASTSPPCRRWHYLH